jgi:hypothetical protein
MRFALFSAPCAAVLYMAATAAARIDNDNSQVVNVEDDTASTSNSTTLFTPTRTAFPIRINSLSNPFDGTITPSPGAVSINQGDQHIEQGPDGVKTVINGDQTIIDGPSGRTVINGDQTIIQTKGVGGGQTMIHVDDESTGGAALATVVPLAGAVLVAGGAMILF